MFALLYITFSNSIIYFLLSACSVYLIPCDFSRQVFFTWKSQLEGVATSDKQIKRIQRYHGLAITHNVLSTSNPSDSEINIAVYTMKKNLISILQQSIQAEDSAKQLRFSPPDKNSWFDWQQEHWPIKGWLLAPGFCGIVALHPHNVKLHRTEMSPSILWFEFSSVIK